MKIKSLLTVNLKPNKLSSYDWPLLMRYSEST